MICPMCGSDSCPSSALLFGRETVGCRNCGSTMKRSFLRIETVLFVCPHCSKSVHCDVDRLGMQSPCPLCHKPFLPLTHTMIAQQKRDAEKTAQEAERLRRARLFTTGQVNRVGPDEVVVCGNGCRYFLGEFVIKDKELRDARDYEPIYNRQGEYVRDEVVAYNYEEIHERFGCPRCLSTMAHLESAHLRGLKHCDACGNWYQGTLSRCPLCHP